jgi:hypothetical protein
VVGVSVWKDDVKKSERMNLRLLWMTKWNNSVW